VPDDDQTPLDPETDPDEDTPDAEGEEPEADDQPGSDPEARLAEKDAYIAQLQQELSLHRGKAQEPEDEAADEGEASSNDLLVRATQDSWALAERLHGGEAIEAYRVAHRLIERAATPADFVTAFEAYHDIRSGKIATKPEGKGAAQGKTRAEALQPRVDANRSDPGSDPNADEKLSEAKKAGSLDKFTAAAAAMMGFGPAKR
jgi:hypothetical protein